MRSILILILLFSSNAIANESADKGLWIAQKIQAADSGWISEQVKTTMTLRAADGGEVVRETRNQSLEVAEDGDKTRVIFDKPADVKGTVFLTHTHKQGNDDQWLYLPALTRIKRISSGNRSGPFMGSEFAYEDISSEEVERYTYHFLRDEQCAGALQCYVFERVPVDQSSGYTKQIVYADKEYFRIHKIEYYDRKELLLKTLTRSDYEKFGNVWRAKHWEMVNHHTRKSTFIIWSEREFQLDLAENDFDTHAMKRLK